MDQRLRDAASVGNIDVLYALIRDDVYLLERINKVPFVDTPLHMAASAGQVEFALEMMNLNPSFARKLNQDGFSPMHLALQNEQTQMAIELLKVDEHLVRVKGREGVTPLHYVAEKGNLYLSSEFLLACPDCIMDVTVRSETALHIAVRNSKFEALEILTGWLRRNGCKNAKYKEIQVLNRRDNEGNTVLHLAAYSNQLQMVGLFMGCRAVERNIKNRRGLTALDISKGQRQENNREISDVIHRAGGLSASSLPSVSTLADALRSKITPYQCYVTYITRKRNEISGDTRNALLVVATLIITATYQTALSPPGGFWQGDNSSISNMSLPINTTASVPITEVSPQHSPGTVVMGGCQFHLIWFCNTLALLFTLMLTAVLLPSAAYSDLLLWTLFNLGISYSVSMFVISPGGASMAKFFMFCLCSYASIIFLITTARMMIVTKKPEPRSVLAMEGLVRLENVPLILGK